MSERILMAKQFSTKRTFKDHDHEVGQWLGKLLKLKSFLQENIHFTRVNLNQS